LILRSPAKSQVKKAARSPVKSLVKKAAGKVAKAVWAKAVIIATITALNAGYHMSALVGGVIIITMAKKESG